MFIWAVLSAETVIKPTLSKGVKHWCLVIMRYYLLPSPSRSALRHTQVEMQTLRIQRKSSDNSSAGRRKPSHRPPVLNTVG